MTVVGIVVGVLVLATPAGAQNTPYGAQPDSATVSDSTVAPGESTTVTAQCFQPGSTVTFTDGQGFNATDVADANGVASVTYDPPPGNGPVTVTASGTGCDGEALVLGVQITRVAGVGAGAGTGNRPLARTGDDTSLELGRIGIALVAAGGLTVYALRRRQLRQAP